jgi:hypothetical protein
MNPASGANLRKAALMLSSLGEEDRAWMLARVGEQERAQLGPLVSEARSLGVQLDAQTLRQLAQSPAAAAPASAAVKKGPLDATSAQAVHEVLAREPDWLIALVLRERSWPWREAFLRLLGTERRLHVQRARPQGASQVRPRVIEALIAAIEARLEELPAEALEAHAPAARVAGMRNGAARKRWTGVLPWRR